MTNKKLNNKLAKSLRKVLGLEFAQAHRMAKLALKGDLCTAQSIIDVGLQVTFNPTSTCSCGDDRGFVVVTNPATCKSVQLDFDCAGIAWCDLL